MAVADRIRWPESGLGARDGSGRGRRMPARRPNFRIGGLAGAIAAAVRDATTARRDLGMALKTDPGFSATGAADARRILDSLPD